MSPHGAPKVRRKTLRREARGIATGRHARLVRINPRRPWHGE